MMKLLSFTVKFLRN